VTPVTPRARGRSRHTSPVPRAAVFGAGIAVAVAAFYVFGSNALNGYRLSREEARLDALKRSLQEQNAILREEIRLLQTPPYIEKIAREQLGLVRPGEIAVLIVRPPAPPPPPPARLGRDTRPLPQRIWAALTRRVQKR